MSLEADYLGAFEEHSPDDIRAKLMTFKTCRRSDKRRESEAAVAGQSREAPTERREGLSCANASGK